MTPAAAPAATQHAGTEWPGLDAWWTVDAGTFPDLEIPDEPLSGSAPLRFPYKTVAELLAAPIPAFPPAIGHVPDPPLTAGSAAQAPPDATESIPVAAPVQTSRTRGRSTTRQPAAPAGRGFGIGTVLTQAAGVVQRGNGRLAGIVQSFATEAARSNLSPFTPAGGAQLAAIVSTHLSRAAKVVADTQEELASYTAYFRGPSAR